MASIQDLKSQISSRGGLSRPNQFMIELPSGDARAANVLCTRVNLPGKQILTHDRRINMAFEKVAYGYAVDDVTMSFLLTNDYGIKTFFNNWRATIIDEENFEVKYKTSYERTVKIHQLKIPINSQEATVDSRNIVYSIELREAFPTTFQSIDLSNDLDAISEFSVQISYTNWFPIESPKGTLPIKIRKPSLDFNLGSNIKGTLQGALSSNAAFAGIRSQYQEARSKANSIGSKFKSAQSIRNKFNNVF